MPMRESIGFRIGWDTVIDATLVAALSSIKSQGQQHDLEMRQTRQDNQWYRAHLENVHRAIMKIFHLKNTIGVCLITCVISLYGCGREESNEQPLSARGSVSLINGDEAPSPNADVIIIGAGISGLAAALDLGESGRSVIVVDMASTFGGHAVMSGGGLSLIDTPDQRERGISDSAELAYSDFLNWGEDINEEWTRYYVEHSRADIYDWITGLGVEFGSVLQPFGNSVPRMHFPKGSGLGLITPIYRATLNVRNIQFYWNTRADSLILRNQTVVGVNLENIRQGTTHQKYASTIIIATGGFQSNLEMVLNNWRRDWPLPERVLAGSGWNSQGDGLKMAETAGAVIERLDHQWNYYEGIPDPRYPASDRALRFMIQPGSPEWHVWLNAQGKRFVNECQSAKHILPEILEQIGQYHWFMFDQKAKPLVIVGGTGWWPEKMEREIYGNEDLVKQALTLEHLAEKMEVPGEILVNSIDRFNQLVDIGRDEDFARFGEDAGPSYCDNVARIDLPPFFAVKRYIMSRKSMGGIKVDIGSRVLDADGNPVPGLYAVGEATGLAGINGKAGLEGTFLGPSILMGRVAARSIISSLSGTPVVQLSSEGRNTTVDKIAADKSGNGASCTDCHDIGLLVAENRIGHKHFEFAHQTVLEDAMDCLMCHNALDPYEPSSHKLNPYDLIETCGNCHGEGD